MTLKGRRHQRQLSPYRVACLRAHRPPPTNCDAAPTREPAIPAMGTGRPIPEAGCFRRHRVVSAVFGKQKPGIHALERVVSHLKCRGLPRSLQVKMHAMSAADTIEFESKVLNRVIERQVRRRSASHGVSGGGRAIARGPHPPYRFFGVICS